MQKGRKNDWGKSNRVQNNRLITINNVIKIKYYCFFVIFHTFATRYST